MSLKTTGAALAILAAHQCAAQPVTVVWYHEMTNLAGEPLDPAQVYYELSRDGEWFSGLLKGLAGDPDNIGRTNTYHAVLAFPYNECHTYTIRAYDKSTQLYSVPSNPVEYCTDDIPADLLAPTPVLELELR